MSKTITETTQENNAITLKKDSKGNYNWEIKIYGEKIKDIINKIKEADDQLRQEYLQ